MIGLFAFATGILCTLFALLVWRRVQARHGTPPPSTVPGAEPEQPAPERKWSELSEADRKAQWAAFHKQHRSAFERAVRAGQVKVVDE